MASGNDKPQETAIPSAPTAWGNETSRARSIATRLTDAEFGEVEAAAADAGKKVAEWLREAALAHARASAGAEEQTDPILLAEIMGMRSLMLNLFARASEGPLTTEDLRKMFALDVTEGSQNDRPLELSPFAVEQGWTGIERTAVESVDSTEVEKLLREDFYDGESFRRLVNEPLLYGVAAWVIVMYLAFMMKRDIGHEWRQLQREVTESQWSTNYGRDWPENRDGIVARIRLRIAHWISEQKTALEWPSFGPAISRRVGLKKLSNPETLRGSDRPASTQFRGGVSTARQLATPPPSHSPKPPSQRRAIFPGSSASDAAHSQTEPWDESKWID